MYTIKASSAVKKDLKRLDKKLQEEIEKVHFPSIEQDPFKAYPLSHQFKGLWSYHISYKGSQYRIVYEIRSEEKVVLVIMIGPRGEFYEALRRRIS